MNFNDIFGKSITWEQYSKNLTKRTTNIFILCFSHVVINYGRPAVIYSRSFFFSKFDVVIAKYNQSNLLFGANINFGVIQFICKDLK